MRTLKCSCGLLLYQSGVLLSASLVKNGAERFTNSRVFNVSVYFNFLKRDQSHGSKLQSGSSLLERLHFKMTRAMFLINKEMNKVERYFCDFLYS